MSFRARIDVDIVYHDYSDTALSVGTLSEHVAMTPTSAATITGTCGTSAVQIVGTAPLSTLVVKNTGTRGLRLGGAIDVAAGRVAVIPTTATVTVAGVGGSGAYTAIWVG
jgi:hypothetical protein